MKARHPVDQSQPRSSARRGDGSPLQPSQTSHAQYDGCATEAKASSTVHVTTQRQSIPLFNPFISLAVTTDSIDRVTPGPSASHQRQQAAVEDRRLPSILMSMSWSMRLADPCLLISGSIRESASLPKAFLDTRGYTCLLVENYPRWLRELFADSPFIREPLYAAAGAVSVYRPCKITSIQLDEYRETADFPWVAFTRLACAPSVLLGSGAILKLLSTAFRCVLFQTRNLNGTVLRLRTGCGGSAGGG